MSVYTYVYPVTRYSELTARIQTSVKRTSKQEVMAFYKQQITPEDEARIRLAYRNGELSDTFRYIRDNLVDRDVTRKPCTYKELMGDCQFYEGLDKIGDKTFYVCLGS